MCLAWPKREEREGGFQILKEREREREEGRKKIQGDFKGPRLNFKCISCVFFLCIKVSMTNLSPNLLLNDIKSMLN